MSHFGTECLRSAALFDGVLHLFSVCVCLFCRSWISYGPVIQPYQLSHFESVLGSSYLAQASSLSYMLIWHLYYRLTCALRIYDHVLVDYDGRERKRIPMMPTQ